MADFSTLNIAANRIVTLGQNITVGSMTVGDSNSTNTYTITGNTLTFNGTGGGTLTSASNIDDNNFLSTVTLGSDLAVHVNGTGRLNIGTKGAFNLGGFTLTNRGIGSGAFRFQSAGTGTDVFLSGSGSIVQDSATSALVLGTEVNAGLATFTGSVTIKKGRLIYSSQRSDILGNRPITIGNSAAGNSDEAIYQVNAGAHTYTLGNPFSLAANTTGVLTIRVNDTGNRVTTFTGGVTGANSLTIDNSAGIASSSTIFSTGALNFSGNLTHIGAGSSTLTINSVIGANVTGVIQNSATSSMELNGTNTYSGTTTISAGTLQIGSSGSIANSSLINVQSGGVFNVASVTGGFALSANQTLAGTGTVTGSVGLTSLTSVLSPGNSPGILPFGTSQSWNSFTYDWESNDWTGTVAGTAFDQIAITGGLMLSPSGSYQLDLLSLTAGNISGTIPNYVDQDRTWTIVSTTTGITGFDASKWNIVTSGFTGVTGTSGRTFSVQQTGNSIELVYAVPEPATLGLAAAAGLLAAAGVARRRARA